MIYPTPMALLGIPWIYIYAAMTVGILIWGVLVCTIIWCWS